MNKVAMPVVADPQIAESSGGRPGAVTCCAGRVELDHGYPHRSLLARRIKNHVAFWADVRVGAVEQREGR